LRRLDEGFNVSGISQKEMVVWAAYFTVLWVNTDRFGQINHSKYKCCISQSVLLQTVSELLTQIKYFFRKHKFCRKHWLHSDIPFLHYLSISLFGTLPFTLVTPFV